MNTCKKQSLVVDARMINTSGIGTVCQNILPYLLRNFQVTLLGDTKELVNFTLASEVKIISVKSKVYSLKEQTELFFKIPDCDFFLSPHYNVPLLPIKANKRVVIIHDVNHIALVKTNNIIKRVYARLVIHFALLLSDKVITVSKFSKSEILRYFNVKADAIKTIVLGINKDIFKINNKNDQSRISTRYNLPEQFLLYVGNVKPHKNLKILIRALAIIKANNTVNTCKLVIVGKKDGFITNDQEIGKEIAELNLQNDIIFTGYVPNQDLPLIYNLVALFVFPSLYEGFGLPSVEAMACGCPTVVSHSSSLPEVCQNASIYFNPEDSCDLAEAISKVLNDINLQGQLRSNGFELVKKYNWENTAQEITDILLAK